MAKKKQHIALDLDGTLLCYHRGWEAKGRFGEPVRGMREFVDELRKKGHKVTIFTSRDDFVEVGEHLHRLGFPDLPITNVKLPEFTIFLDDRAIGFEPTKVERKPDFQELVEVIDGFEPWWV